MNAVTRFPLDFDSLKKGDVIPASEVEKITGVQRNDPKFQLEVVKLCGRIYQEMEERNKPITLLTKGGSIRVCTDSEALEVNERRQSVKRDGLLRDHRRVVNIERDNLSAPQLEKHNFLMLAGANMLSGMKQGLKLARKGLVYNQVMPIKLRDIRKRQQQIEDKRGQSAS